MITLREEPQFREVTHPKHDNPVVEFLSLSASLVGGAVLVSVGLALVLEVITPLCPPQWEASLRFLAGGMTNKQVHDPQGLAEQQRLQRIVNRLLKKNPGPAPGPFQFQVVLVKEKFPNAFAVPGGQIVVTQELVKLSRSDHELAFVLGHELGHFRYRHHLKGIGRALVLSLAEAVIPGEGRMLVNQLIGQVSMLTLAQFSQHDELDADAYGLKLVRAAGYNPQGAGLFFTKLEALEKKHHTRDSVIDNFYASHPLSKDRRVAIDKTLRELRRK